MKITKEHAVKMETNDAYYYVDFIDGDDDFVTRGEWYKTKAPNEQCNALVALGLAYTSRESAAEAARKMLEAIN